MEVESVMDKSCYLTPRSDYSFVICVCAPRAIFVLHLSTLDLTRLIDCQEGFVAEGGTKWEDTRRDGRIIGIVFFYSAHEIGSSIISYYRNRKVFLSFIMVYRI